MMSLSVRVKTRLLQLIQQLGDDPTRFVRDPKKDFTRQSRLSLTTVVSIILSMGASSLKKELHKAFHLDTHTPSVSALCQQRMKIRIDAFYHLPYGLNASFERAFYKGYSLIACDGSALSLPLVLGDGDYSYRRKRADQKDYSQIHLNALYDLVSRRYLDIVMAPRRENDEKKAFLKMLGRGTFSKKTIFVMDRGYESYDVLGSIYRMGMSFVLRAKDGSTGGIVKAFHLQKKGEYDKTFTRIFTTRRNKTVLSQPEVYHTIRWARGRAFLDKDHPYIEMTLRILRIQIAPGTYECIITDLPADKFSLQEIKKIYRMRWGIETSFRELKYDLSLDHIHSKKAECIQQEIVARMVLYNFSSIITSHVAVEKKERRYAYQINRSMAFFLCRMFLCAPADGTPPDIEPLIAAELLPVRPDRSYRRKIRSHPAISFLYRPI